MLRKIIHFVIRIVTRLLVRVQVEGLENMPLSGGCLVCMNHLSILDPAVFFLVSPRQDLTALVATKHRKNPFLRLLVDTMGGIWLNREQPDPQALRMARDYLKAGGALGIAAEGTRSPTGALIQAKPGVAFLADKGGAPVLPVAISGSEQFGPSLRRLRRAKVTLRIGEPFNLPPVPRQGRDEALERNTDEIMCQIAALLPEAYRGVYAEHPRLQEILAGQTQMANRLPSATSQSSQ